MNFAISCAVCGEVIDPLGKHSHGASIQDTQGVERSQRSGHFALLQHRIVAAPTPAAGADPIFIVPALSRWELQNLGALLTTSAVVANRVPHLIVDDNQGHQVYNFPASTNQVASSAVQYAAGVGVVAASNDNATMLVLPYPLHLNQGWRVGFKTTGLDVGDQWTVFALLVHEWVSY
jgi:hypothetical protein